jgi:hypothetical protein
VPCRPSPASPDRLRTRRDPREAIALGHRPAWIPHTLGPLVMTCCTLFPSPGFPFRPCRFICQVGASHTLQPASQAFRVFTNSPGPGCGFQHFCTLMLSNVAGRKSILAFFAFSCIAPHPLPLPCQLRGIPKTIGLRHVKCLVASEFRHCTSLDQFSKADCNLSMLLQVAGNYVEDSAPRQCPAR